MTFFTSFLVGNPGASGNLAFTRSIDFDVIPSSRSKKYPRLNFENASAPGSSAK